MAGFEIVRTVGTEEEASLIAGYLAAGGIEASVESLLFHQEPVNFGRLGEVRVLVAAADAERARELLDRMPAPAGEDEIAETEGEGEA
jgi:hypothetical protein